MYYYYFYISIITHSNNAGNDEVILIIAGLFIIQATRAQLEMLVKLASLDHKVLPDSQEPLDPSDHLELSDSLDQSDGKVTEVRQGQLVSVVSTVR